MLIKESQLVAKTNILDQLNEAVYLTEEESAIYPAEISVFEMSRLGEGVTMVRFADVERLAEDSQVSYMDAVAAIAEASEVDASKLTIAVDEADLIVDPTMVQEMSYVVVPTSTNDELYKLCETVVDQAIEGDNPEFIEEAMEAVVNEISGTNVYNLATLGAGLGLKAYTQHKKNTEVDKAYNKMASLDVDKGTIEHVWKNDPRSKYKRNQSIADALIGAGVTSTIIDNAGSVGKIYTEYKNKPKNKIAEVIAKLRKVYSKLMEKLETPKFKEIGTTKGNLKMLAGRILKVIDKLMLRLQQGANKLSK